MFSKIHIPLVFLRMEKQRKNLLKMRVRHSLVVDVLAGTIAARSLVGRSPTFMRSTCGWRIKVSRFEKIEPAV
jgi:predicted membrane GTPase involved in stress response